MLMRKAAAPAVPTIALLGGERLNICGIPRATAAPAERSASSLSGHRETKETALSQCRKQMAHSTGMSDSKVTFSVTVHDLDLAKFAEANELRPEDDAADYFSLVASGFIADALHEKYDDITIGTQREDGSLLFTERPGDFPD